MTFASLTITEPESAGDSDQCFVDTSEMREQGTVERFGDAVQGQAFPDYIIKLFYKPLLVTGSYKVAPVARDTVDRTLITCNEVLSIDVASIIYTALMWTALDRKHVQRHIYFFQ